MKRKHEQEPQEEDVCTHAYYLIPFIHANKNMSLAQFKEENAFD